MQLIIYITTLLILPKIFHTQYIARDNLNVPCSFFDSINITDSKRLKNGSYLHDGLIYPSNLVGIYDYKFINLTTRIKTNSHLRGCLCHIKTCIRLCCPKYNKYHEGDCINIGNSLVTDLKVHKSIGSFVEVDIYQNFGIVYGFPCNAHYFLEPTQAEYDKWELLENGTIFRMDDKALISKNEYCLSPIHEGQSSTVTINPAVCFQEVQTRPKDIINSLAMLFSVPFLLITIFVYLLIPELRNLHGKSLVCYLAGLAYGYSCFGYLRYTGSIGLSQILCETLGFSSYFALMSSFFWLSTISFDLWWNFRGPRGISRLNENKRFMVYALYSWGMAFLFLLVVIFVQKSNAPEYLKPGIGGGQYCTLDVHYWIQFLYFFGPILIIICFNTVMFIITATKIYRVQKDMKNMFNRDDSQKNLNHDKDKFGLFLRLFIIMGVTWLMETISWLVGDDNLRWVFYLTDFCNGIQGFIIFAMFVLKKKIKKLTIKRYRSLRGLPAKTSQYSSKTNSSNITMASNGQPIKINKTVVADLQL